MRLRPCLLRTSRTRDLPRKSLNLIWSPLPHFRRARAPAHAGNHQRYWVVAPDFPLELAKSARVLSPSRGCRVQDATSQFGNSGRSIRCAVSDQSNPSRRGILAAVRHWHAAGWPPCQPMHSMSSWAQLMRMQSIPPATSSRTNSKSCAASLGIVTMIRTLRFGAGGPKRASVLARSNVLPSAKSILRSRRVGATATRGLQARAAPSRPLRSRRGHGIRYVPATKGQARLAVPAPDGYRDVAVQGSGLDCVHSFDGRRNSSAVARTPFQDPASRRGLLGVPSKARRAPGGSVRSSAQLSSVRSLVT